MHGTPIFQANIKAHAHIIKYGIKLKSNIPKSRFIMVAEATYPNYLPIMLSSKGIITEVGGLLSHAAIVAREFRIPCVVGVEDAMKYIKEGDSVEIYTDGTIIVDQV